MHRPAHRVLEHPDLAPWRPPAGITPRLSGAELVTLATMQAALGCTSEAKWLRHARARLRHLFPCVPLPIRSVAPYIYAERRSGLARRTPAGTAPSRKAPIS